MPSGIRKDIYIQSILATMRDVEANFSSYPTVNAKANLFSVPISAALKSEGVPVPTFRVYRNPGKTSSLFNFSDWRIDVREPSGNQTPSTDDERKAIIAEICGTMAHEARHCEQMWRMILRTRDKIKAEGKSVGVAQLQSKLPGVAEHILQKAVAPAPYAGFLPKSKRLPKPEKMPPPTPPEKEADEWYESMFGKGYSEREATLALSQHLSRVQGHYGFKLHQEEDWFADTAYAKYQYLPEEKDAWEFGIEIQRQFLKGTNIPTPGSFVRAEASGGVSSF